MKKGYSIISVTAAMIFFSALFSPALLAVSKTSEETAVFSIDITGIKKQTGNVRVAIFNSKDSWLKKPVFTAILPANSKRLEYTNASVPFGDYGVAVYHDVNDNGDMDSNFIGLPKEPYGFSNNARGTFGPAKWKKAKVSVSQNINNLKIRIK